MTRVEGTRWGRQLKVQMHVLHTSLRTTICCEVVNNNLRGRLMPTMSITSHPDVYTFDYTSTVLPISNDLIIHSISMEISVNAEPDFTVKIAVTHRTAGTFLNRQSLLFTFRNGLVQNPKDEGQMEHAVLVMP
jgi:hypothetical protein